MTDAPGLTFAIADLHGRRDLLDAAFDAISAYPGAAGTVLTLGDYVDRGPDSCGVIERLIAGPPAGWRLICLKGNHEAMMALALRNPERLDWWIENGGAATIASYRGAQDRIARHLAWIDALPSIHIDTHRVFVHAGVDPAMPVHAQAEKTLLWKRYGPEAVRGHGTYHVVHGHDPGPDRPLRLAGRTNLDTLAWQTGRLVIGVFDDAIEGGPIDLIDVRRPAMSWRAAG